MIHFKSIFKILGILLLIEGGVMLLCALIPLLLGEHDLFGFLASALIAACAGMLCMSFNRGHRSRENILSRRDGYVVVTLSWLLFSVFGSFPYFLSREIPGFTNAFFETISGFTTTGATILTDIEALPHGLLFWRSLTQWIGGLGIVFFTVAVLPIFGVGDVQLFAAEAIGPTHGKLHPRISVSGRWIMTVYVVLTIACFVALKLCGMGTFDSVNHAMCTTATGGFSTKNASIGAFGSVAIENTITVFMFLSGINFGLLFFLLFKGKIKKMFSDTEFKWYFEITVASIAIIALCVFLLTPEDFSHSLRESAFHVVSTITTTGFLTTDFNDWPPVICTLLSFMMCFGACAGSTTGGMKAARTVILFKALRNEFNRILHPNAVLPIRISGKVIPQSTKQTVFTFTIIYIGLIIISWLVYMICGMDLTSSFGTAVAFAGNTGVAVGGYGCSISWDLMPLAAKWYSCLMMLVSRLEIFAVLLLLTPAFWKHT